MLQSRETRITRTKHANVVSGHVIPEEGMALVYVKEDGETKVQLSTGAAGEIFAGVSQSRNSPPAALPFVQEGVIPAVEAVELPRTPIAGQLLVRVAGTQKTIVTGAPADATEVQLSGRSLVFFAGERAKGYSAQFLYAPTVTEARTVIGDAPIGGLSSTAQGVIGRLLDAEFSTNMFDASADWTDVMFVKTGPGGTFVPGTANDRIQNAIVKNAPNSGNPFLALGINVA